jgi:hypothetical protein
MAGSWTKTVSEHHCIRPSAYTGKQGVGSVWRCECGKEFEVIGKEKNSMHPGDPREPYELNLWREYPYRDTVLGGYRDR